MTELLAILVQLKDSGVDWGTILAVAAVGFRLELIIPKKVKAEIKPVVADLEIHTAEIKELRAHVGLKVSQGVSNARR